MKFNKKTKIISVIVAIVLIVAALITTLCLVLGKNNKISIKYMVNGTWEEVKIEKDAKLSSINAKKITGYSFKGWFSDKDLKNKVSDDEIAKDGAEYYAKFEPNTYDVYYYSNAGDDLFEKNSVVFDSNYELIENPFTKENSTFIGWSVSQNTAWNETNKIVAEHTSLKLTSEGLKYYAVWKEEEITERTVQFSSNGGSGTHESFVIDGSLNSLDINNLKTELESSITRNGFVLKGFALSADSTSGAYQFDLSGVSGKTITLFAVWEIDENNLVASGLDAGYYPQTYVGDKTNEILISAFESGSLTETGKTYVTNMKEETGEMIEYYYDFDKNGVIDELNERVVRVEKAKTSATNIKFNGTDTAVTNDNTYFFKVEPIHFDVFEKDGKLVAVIQTLLFSDRFGANNKWNESDTRALLNGTFLTESGLENYAKPETHKISSNTSNDDGVEVTDTPYLPSYLDIQNYYTTDGARKKLVSDFALATNTYYNNSNGAGMYYLRSTGYREYEDSTRVNYTGAVSEKQQPVGTNNYQYGVCVAFTINV